MNLLKRLLLGPLCILLCSLPVSGSPQTGAQHAGQMHLDHGGQTRFGFDEFFERLQEEDV